ncbi:response regulator [Rhodococcus erythropolis]|uniref:response regulator n=1 Tax=Rhodococcus erythropolis TaxID=1833 RepID=UPI002226C9F9|nr:response regulator [Rhodococcus erythropolis]MCW2295515.1 DNA-binding NarL/FixJ family response regulator [Rhodococcus erythropolis]
MNTARTSRFRVAVVEDHRLQRVRTEELLNSSGLELVFSGETAPEFLAWSRSVPRNERPHLLVLDLMVERQPNVDVELVCKLLEAGLRIVVLSALASPSLVQSMIKAGVSAIVGKRDSEEAILAAVHAALRGEEWMSPELATIIAGDSNRPKLSIQEERALLLYASGLTLQQVGDAMNISKETAKQYLDRTRKKYSASGITLKTQLDFGKVAWRERLIEP